MVFKLKQARAMLSGGWSGPDLEPFCLARAPGVCINPLYGQPLDDGTLFPPRPMWLPTKTIWTLDAEHEGVELYSVLGACEVVGLGYDGFVLLEEVCRPPAGLQTWLRASNRLTQHVLEVFTDAIKRIRKTTGERR